MEFRAFWEFGAIVPFWPLLQRAPLGDGHPVIVFPGLSASDGSTVPLRSYLTNRNYDVSGWNQGHNFGPRAGVLEAGSHQIRETFLAAGKRKVSLIGWSLGGIYARELAKLHPPPAFIRGPTASSPGRGACKSAAGPTRIPRTSRSLPVTWASA